MNEDMSQFLSVFLQEASEQMVLLEQDILKLEQEASQELLQEIFRAAHTLKGSSRAMGFTTMGELTHAMEDVFDSLRHGQLAVIPALIDALFGGLDALKVMLEQVASTGTTALDTVQLTGQLRAVLTAATAPAPPEAVGAVAPTPVQQKANSGAQPAGSTAAPSMAPGRSAVVLTDAEHSAYQDALVAGYSIYSLMIEVVPDCVMKSVRAAMVLQALEQVGSVLGTYPDEEGLESEHFETTFEVVVATLKPSAELTRAAHTVNEIKSVIAEPWYTHDAGEPGSATAPAADVVNLQTIAVGNPTKDTAESRPALAAGSNRPDNAATSAEATEAKPPASPAASKTETRTASQPQTVRVDVARLDSLLNLIGELVIDRTRIAQLSSQLEGQFGLNPVVEHLNDTSAHVARITDQLQDEIMKARMLPIENVFSRFPRMVRDLAQKMGKEINFIVEGKETELDRSVIEVVGDPLIHMLRNSVDHGIEMPDEREQSGKSRVGNVWLSARHQENHIVIEVKDDGKGIDPDQLRASAVKKGLMSKEAAARLSDKEAINLIFASGFSTAAVISDVSGRGVGMDIVKNNIQKLGAIIDVESTVGKGSTFTVKLPLTLAIIRGLLVTVQGNVYALPLGAVVETLRIEQDAVKNIQRQPNVVLRGKTLPLVQISDLFPLRQSSYGSTRLSDGAGGQAVVHRRTEDAQARHTEAEASDGAASALYVVVVGAANRQVGLIVDTLVGEQEVVIKTLGKFIGEIPGLSGATILGDGRMGLIVDVAGIITMAVQKKGTAYAA